jgi:hypothetical protein
MQCCTTSCCIPLYRDIQSADLFMLVAQTMTFVIILGKQFLQQGARGGASFFLVEKNLCFHFVSH